MRPASAFVEFKKHAIEQSIPRRFEQQVVRDPAQLAVKEGASAVTYVSLNRMANRIGRALASQGAKESEPIALLAGNDTVTLAGILGILKAGGIYVPLDASLSPERMKSLLEDTRAKIILTSNKSLSLGRELFSSTRLLVNMENLDGSLSDENLDVATPPAALAYILYTSGSTGRPKGVAETHRNILHYVMRVTNPCHISPSDRMTLLRPPSSCGALMNAFSALLNGASLFPLQLKDASLALLADWLSQEKITFLQLGATVFRQFMQLLTGRERFPSLRLIRLSSGPVSKTDVDSFRRHFAECILLHVLSSTEANTYRMQFVHKDSEVREGALPLGCPVQDMQVLILDDAGKELPVNTTGEIAVRSAYLFPGYWNKPELTNAVFLPDPDGGDRRIYRTGDLGRLRPDGCLEYAGRKDFRVKIRGHSVQTEEVELALLEITEIEQAVVVARRDERRDDRLVAYLVPRFNSMPSVSRLRELLQAKLPDYMLPSAFVTLDSLPLTAHGKVNRERLPEPSRARPELSSRFAEPCTPVERVIAKIWSEALEIDPIGVHDSFFDLGGDSLLASKVVSTLSNTFPWSLSLREFFEAPTVAKIAGAVMAKEPRAGRADRIARVMLKIADMSAAEIQAAVKEERTKRGDGQADATFARDK
jgi:amino acid adenylation domain-containing protein